VCEECTSKSRVAVHYNIEGKSIFKEHVIKKEFARALSCDRSATRKKKYVFGEAADNPKKRVES
jgi:hypothetical protein